MDLKQRFKLISEIYVQGRKVNYFTEDCETIYRIDPESDICEYFVSVTAECGCCGENEFRDSDLSLFLNSMSESDFEGFVRHLKFD